MHERTPRQQGIMLFKLKKKVSIIINNNNNNAENISCGCVFFGQMRLRDDQLYFEFIYVCFTYAYYYCYYYVHTASIVNALNRKKTTHSEIFTEHTDFK